MQPPGILYVVATPIGNLSDLSARAIQVLTAVDLIAAEDTRTTRHLLAHFGIATPLLACHEHNESALVPRLLAELDAGRSLALVSDAGTPLISDPGHDLVAAARQRDLRVVPIPGACAAICALSAAGLPSDRFLFLGFPPRAPARRRTWLAAVAAEPGTLILYESTQRAVATLRDIAQVLGATRRLVLARELTKQFETVLSGQPADLIRRLETDPEQRLGELVILIAGHRPGPADDAGQAESIRVLRILTETLPLRQAAALAARLTGGRKNALYRLGIDLGLADGVESPPGVGQTVAPPPGGEESPGSTGQGAR